MLNRRLMNNDASLTGKKAVLSLAEKDREILEEIKNNGFIRESRLVGAEDVPKHRSIEAEIEKGVLKFIRLPESSGPLYLMGSKDRLDFFTEDPGDLKLIYPTHEFAEIAEPRIGAKYDLHMLIKDSAWSIPGKKRAIYTNTLSAPYHFKEIRCSLIDVILLKEGNLRIDLINLECESLSFVSSEQFSNSMDIELDGYPKIGDIFLTEVKNGLVIHHPVLWQALKMQAELGIVDRYNGRFYAHVSYLYAPDEFGERFVDANKVQNKSSMQVNIERFSYDEAGQ